MEINTEFVKESLRQLRWEFFTYKEIEEAFISYVQKGYVVTPLLFHLTNVYNNHFDGFPPKDINQILNELWTQYEKNKQKKALP